MATVKPDETSKAFGGERELASALTLKLGAHGRKMLDQAERRKPRVLDAVEGIVDAKQTMSNGGRAASRTTTIV